MEFFAKLWTKYTRQTLAFMSNKVVQEKFNFYFSGIIR